MSGNLNLLPWRKLLVGVLELPLDLGLQLADFLDDIDIPIGRKMSQYLDFPLEVGDRLLKIKKHPHAVSRLFGQGVEPHHDIRIPDSHKRDVQSSTSRSGHKRWPLWLCILCFPGEWVMLLDDRAQSFAQHVSIDLRGGNIRVAEHLLDTAQISAVVEQMGCKGVSQHVR